MTLPQRFYLPQAVRDEDRPADEPQVVIVTLPLDVAQAINRRRVLDEVVKLILAAAAKPGVYEVVIDEAEVRSD